MRYQHTQTGQLMIYVIFGILLMFGYILAKAGFNAIIFGEMLLIIAIVASFSYLTVTIDESALRIKFGYGIYRKSFDLSEIASVKIVRNHWYYGWGIRFSLSPRMWIYNVSGFDAVELRMKNGKVYRIGTDDPQMLNHSITQAIK